MNVVALEIEVFAERILLSPEDHRATSLVGIV